MPCHHYSCIIPCNCCLVLEMHFFPAATWLLIAYVATAANASNVLEVDLVFHAMKHICPRHGYLLSLLSGILSAQNPSVPQFPMLYETGMTWEGMMAPALSMICGGLIGLAMTLTSSTTISTTSGLKVVGGSTGESGGEAVMNLLTLCLPSPQPSTS